MFADLVFLYPRVGLIVGGILLLGAFYRFWFYKPLRYNYPLTSFLAQYNQSASKVPQYLIFFIRFFALCLLVLLTAGLRRVDRKSQIRMQGIDIMLLLDVSGSMQAFDDINNPCMRIDAAKKEAIRFIEGRNNDQLGLVLFGKHAVSRCPLTIDKNILIQIIKELSLGVIDPEGTMLAQGMLIAANRLKNSTTATKIMIVLTDGYPTPGDIPIEEVMLVIKKLGIKVYTIGIGSQEGAYIHHPLVGIVPVQTPLNQELLQAIATQSGGASFLASNPDELREVYKAIDALEKTDRDVPIFTSYVDFFKELTLAALCLLSFEWLLTTLVWFVI